MPSQAWRDAMRYLMDNMDGMDDMDRATARATYSLCAFAPLREKNPEAQIFYFETAGGM